MSPRLALGLGLPETLGCALVLMAAAATAQPKAQEAAFKPQEAVFRLNMADPESSVPTQEQANKQPLGMGYFLMDLADAADRASKRGDHAAAIKFYRAMAKAVPERGISYSKQCIEYQAMGERYKAIDACWEALAHGGLIFADYQRFVTLVLEGQGKLSQDYVKRLDQVLAHLREQAKSDADLVLPSSLLECEVGVRLEDVKRVESCTKQLQKLAPKDPKTLTFRWALAMLHKDRSEAERVIAQAKQAKAPEAVLERMAAGLRVMQGPSSRELLQARALPIAIGLLCLGAIGWALTRRRLQRAT